MINNTDDLRRWFQSSGVAWPLDACIGPLPHSGAALGRYSSDRADDTIRPFHPHPGSYRLSLMLAPLEARIWHDGTPVWGGLIAANRFRLCPPGETGHWSRASGCDIVNLFIPLALVERLANLRGSGGSTLAVQSFVTDRLVLDLVHKMLDAQAIAGRLAQEACDGLMSTLVCYLLEHYGQPMDLAGAGQGGLAGVRLRRVLEHIAQGCAGTLSNAELAALCGMSEAHFAREFRRAVGLPPHQYMTRLRMERACAALRRPDARILDIAQECGFASASHFSRAFTLHCGMSPSRFRARNLENNGT